MAFPEEPTSWGDITRPDIPPLVTPRGEAGDPKKPESNAEQLPRSEGGSPPPSLTRSWSPQSEQLQRSRSMTLLANRYASPGQRADT